MQQKGNWEIRREKPRKELEREKITLVEER